MRSNAVLLAAHGAVVFTYGLSPFSAEAIELLEDVGAKFHVEEVGVHSSGEAQPQDSLRH